MIHKTEINAFMMGLLFMSIFMVYIIPCMTSLWIMVIVLCGVIFFNLTKNMGNTFMDAIMKYLVFPVLVFIVYNWARFMSYHMKTYAH